MGVVGVVMVMAVTMVDGSSDGENGKEGVGTDTR